MNPVEVIGGRIIQVFPLTRGRINKQPGATVYPKCLCFFCVEDGQLTFSSDNGRLTDTQSFVSGDCFGVPEGQNSVVVVSGKFHLS